MRGEGSPVFIDGVAGKESRKRLVGLGGEKGGKNATR